MFRDAHSLIQEGLQLPPEERLEVADRLYESVPGIDEGSREVYEEAHRRLEEHRRGIGAYVTREDMMNMAEQMIRTAERAKK
jgi:hypothetical protein